MGISALDIDTLDSRIKELVAYARERDSEDRTVLFRNLVDLFLTSKAPSREPTRSQLLDVIEALIPHVDKESRRTASELVASMSNPPFDLALRLCHDRASLVSELLKNIPFDEDAFIELIAATGREHHHILASRSDLSANVWIALARAAPAAPPFDSRSTLALWRDDLGTRDDEQTSQPATVTQLHTNDASKATAPESNPPKPASLRILRTDEDIVATHRIVPPQLPDEEQQDTVKPLEAALAPAAKGTDIDLNDIVAEALQRELNKNSDDTSKAEETSEQRLKDPGPGGWSWRADRDGFITEVSPQGIRLLGPADTLVGLAMLDLLGLNMKLDHPVSRAFQRRSTIHDAPICLEQLDKPHQHWTLEAAPVFSSGGGIFEGYEGALTPVIFKKTAEEAPIGAPDPEAPLFLDEPEAAPNQDLVNKVTEGLKEPAIDAPAEKPQTEQKVDDTSARKAPPQDDDISATLDMLDEALKRLSDTSKNGGTMQARLQTEIAAACARTLREQLKK